MAYLVDIRKPPTTLVRELFNHFNDTTYSEGQLLIGTAHTSPPQIESYDTAAEVTVVDSSNTIDIPHAIIYYNRIDLATLFSVVEVKLREVDIKADGTFDEALILQ